METTLIQKLFSSFEDIKHTEENGVEYWSARELQHLLTYKEWRNFETVLEKAMEACRKAGDSKFDHFVGVNKMVSLGSDAEREVFDIHLTRLQLTSSRRMAIHGNKKSPLLRRISRSRRTNKNSSRKNSSTSSLSMSEKSSHRLKKNSQDSPSNVVSMV